VVCPSSLRDLNVTFRAFPELGLRPLHTLVQYPETIRRRMLVGYICNYYDRLRKRTSCVGRLYMLCVRPAATATCRPTTHTPTTAILMPYLDAFTVFANQIGQFLEGHRRIG